LCGGYAGTPEMLTPLAIRLRAASTINSTGEHSMYTPTIAGSAVVSGGALAFTGFGVLWAVLGGFALLSAGLAILRLSFRREA
jgi:hypothetical protein